MQFVAINCAATLFLLNCIFAKLQVSVQEVPDERINIYVEHCYRRWPVTGGLPRLVLSL